MNDPTLWERAVGATMPCISIFIADSIMVGGLRILVVTHFLRCFGFDDSTNIDLANLDGMGETASGSHPTNAFLHHQYR